MAFDPVTLPDAGAVNYGGGDIDYYAETDPVAAGADQLGPDNRPLRNMAYRDQLLADKVNQIISQFGADLLSSYYISAQDPIAMTVLVDAGRSVKVDGTGAVVLSSQTTSPTFPSVTTIGNARFDLLVLDDSGTLSIVAGPGEVPEASDPYTNSSAFPNDKLVLGIIRVAGRATPGITQDDIFDMREFLNKGGGAGNATALMGIDIFGTPGASEDGYVLKYIHSAGRYEWRPDSTGAGTITVKDGVTTVSGCSVINFTSGATVTNAGGGQADVAISGGGGAGYLPDQITDFNPDDNDAVRAENVTLWQMQPAVRFNSDADRSTWFTLNKAYAMDNSADIVFALWFALTTSAANNFAVKLTLDYWVVGDTQTPDINTPTNTLSEDVDVSFNAGNKLSRAALSTIKINKSDFAATGTAQRFICRLTRNITGAGTNDYVDGAFDLISLIPSLV